MYNEKNLINIVVTKEIQIHDNFRRKGKIKMKARVNFYIGEKNAIFLVFCILLTGLFSSAGGRGQKVYPLKKLRKYIKYSYKCPRMLFLDDKGGRHTKIFSGHVR